MVEIIAFLIGIILTLLGIFFLFGLAVVKIVGCCVLILLGAILIIAACS